MKTENKVMNFKGLKDKLFFIFITLISLFVIVFLVGIIYSIFKNGYEIFRSVGIIKFVFGFNWFPTYEPQEFGIFPLIIGSLAVTLMSIIICIPFGLGSAIYISEIAKPKEKEFLKPFLEILASIPSVIYGLFGMVFLAPLVRRVFNIDSGFNLLTASIILGFMVVPVVASFTEDALNAVPLSLREASYALGANKWETIWKVVVPSSISGITSAIVLGFGRAIGETMVVLMVAGNSSKIPRSLLDSVRPMSSTIAAEMGETAFGTLHFHALFGIAIVLFVITFVLNIITEFVRHRFIIKRY